jgi:polysaccharide biosynthesis protein PslG
MPSPRTTLLVLLAGVLCVFGLQNPVSAQTADVAAGNYVISSEFFGMHINTFTDGWPAEPFGTQRLLNSNVNWANIETAPGVYNFHWLDQWLAQSQTHNVTLLYTFVDVPQFYSSVPTDTTCSYVTNGAGGCHPPKDLNADGTGTNQAFRNFVTAMVQHVGNRIQYWEVWNEPNQLTAWQATDPVNHPYNQLLRMQADAYQIIKAANPDALILTPPPVGFPYGAPHWEAGYLAAGGANNADVIAFHSYVHKWIMGNQPVPENVALAVTNMVATMQKYNVTKPLWITESGWGRTDKDGFTDETLQTGFTARYILLEQSSGVAHAYWYQWDSNSPYNSGTFFLPPSTTRTPGTAYAQVYNWTSGATLSVPCAASGTVWTCQYARAGGYTAMAVWNTTGDSTFTVPAGGYTQYRDLLGNTTTITGPTVTVGLWPILLESMDSGVGDSVISQPPAPMGWVGQPARRSLR